MQSSENIVSLKNISKSFGSRLILDNLNLEIKRGDFIAILGLSGSGKSTLLNILGLLDFQFDGDYLFDDEKLDIKKHGDEYRAKKIGFIFQLFFLVPKLSVLDNIKLPYLFLDDYDKDKVDSFARELIDRLEIGFLLDQECANLSGGEKQRVALARALIHNPEILICDEPTGNLDDKNCNIVMDILNEENKKGKTIIVVTHNHEVANMAKKIYRLENGRLNIEKNS